MRAVAAATMAPNQTASLVSSLVQAGVFLFLGPAVCAYGPAFFRIVVVIRSLFAVNYLTFFGNVGAVDAMTAIDVFGNGLVLLIVNTMTLAMTSLKNREARAYTRGAVLGVMVATPALEVIRNQLFFGPIGCTHYGEKSQIFPEGIPVGGPMCTPLSDEFQYVYQGTKGAQIAIVGAFAMLGKHMLNLSTATVGSTMIVKGSFDLLSTVLLMYYPDDAVSILQTFKLLELFVTYGLAVLGYAIQKIALTRDFSPEELAEKERWKQEKEEQLEKDKVELEKAKQLPGLGGKVAVYKVKFAMFKHKHKKNRSVYELDDKEYRLIKKEDIKKCKCLCGLLVGTLMQKYVGLLHKLDHKWGEKLNGDRDKTRSGTGAPHRV